VNIFLSRGLPVCQRVRVYALRRILTWVFAVFPVSPELAPMCPQFASHRDNYVFLMWSTAGWGGRGDGGGLPGFDSVCGSPTARHVGRHCRSRDRRRPTRALETAVAAAIGNFRLAIRMKAPSRSDSVGRGDSTTLACDLMGTGQKLQHRHTTNVVTLTDH